MGNDDQVFGQFILDAGLVSRSQLDSLRQSDVPLSRALIDSGVMGEDEVRRAAAHALGVPFITLDPHDVPIEALVLIPEPLSRARGLVAFAQSDDSISVALLDLADLAALAPLQTSHFGSRRLVPHLTTAGSIKQALIKYQKHLKEKFGELLTGGMRVAEALVGHALYSRAGGAQVDLSVHGALVRYQVGHTLHEAMRLPEQAGRALVEQLKALAKLLPVSRPQEGKFKLNNEDGTVHVHVSSVPTAGGERLHVRFAHASDGARGHTLEALGLHGESLSALHAALGRRRGTVLVAGAFGSGKSTLLYTLLDLMQHPGLSVALVEEQAGVPAVVALRAMLKQYPDVIMIDDVRDAEVAALAGAAAARGIFVLAGTDDESLLPQADVLVRTALAGRLATNQFVHMAPLARAESDILEQAADFRRVYEALKDENIIEPNLAWKDVQFARRVPSTEHQDGYDGLIGLQEVVAPGFETLNIVEDALFKAAQGLTSVEEAMRTAGA
jgi:hypothetical protein